MLRFIHAWLIYTWGGLHRYFGNQNNLPREHERAIHYFARAYEIDPTFRQAQLARATLLWRELKRVDEALDILNTLLTQDPTYGQALFNRAMAHQANTQYQAALNDLETYLQLPPTANSYHDEATRMAIAIRAFLTDDTP